MCRVLRWNLGLFWGEVEGEIGVGCFLMGDGIE